MDTTESASHYDNLENMSVEDLLTNINQEDQTVPIAVNKVIPRIKDLVEKTVELLSKGGRLFYIGAGTSGRLGIVDASECPPSFGVPPGKVVGLIAGGDKAIRTAVEFAEDSSTQAWEDLQAYDISSKDLVIGIAASGTTPYVVGGLQKCQSANITTGCITCNNNTPAAGFADYPIEVIVGPEFVTGSTRMKAGTAQKMVLNMISTSVMIKLGRVKGNKMMDMQINNSKLFHRATRILTEELNIKEEVAKSLLENHKNIRSAINWYRANA